jgi:hypothetical protein
MDTHTAVIASRDDGMNILYGYAFLDNNYCQSLAIPMEISLSSIPAYVIEEKPDG